ncbi:19066_t:CDS:2 [Dentiscutata erythropus]|uniref:19066_t:CDS:1 n=1 Tax=Dentiscutata erythropus TaxID=1348616 RepID=A0A9N9I343_9GLOM|nr:19066_t:CDS:2 [Dentiscutata erythropus]
MSLEPLSEGELAKKYRKYHKLLEGLLWTAQEVDISQDRRDWDFKMSPEERHFIKFQIAFFVRADIDVLNNLDENFGDEIDCLEARCYITTQKYQECVHIEGYNLQTETLLDEKSLQEVLKAFQSWDAVARMRAWVLKWFDRVVPIEHRLIAFAAVEGVLFSASFASLQWLRERKHLPGVTTFNTFIARDEGVHTLFTCLLVRSYLRKKPPQHIAEKIFSSAVETLDGFVDASLPASLRDMNPDSLKRYVCFQADCVLKTMGYRGMYNGTNPFPFMDKLTLNEYSKLNFFETQVTQYQTVVSPGAARLALNGRRDRGADSSVAVEEDFTQEDLLQKLVVFNESIMQYLVFDSERDFWSYHRETSEKLRNFHEVIFGFQTQRLKFDLGISVDKKNDINILEVLKTIIGCILALLHEYYSGTQKILFTSQDLGITDSSGETTTSYKHSYHIIVLFYAFSDNIETSAFTRKLRERLPPEFRPYLGSETLGVTIPRSWSELFIANREGLQGIARARSEAWNIGGLPNEKREFARELEDYREVPPCRKRRFVGVVHEKDWTWEVHASPNQSGFPRKSQQARLLDHIEKINSGEIDPWQNIERELSRLPPEPQRREYTNSDMLPYELVDTLAVRAQMKLGKTKALRTFLDQYFPEESLKDSVIRFVTFRQTFSNSLQEQFPDFSLYSEIQGDLDTTTYPRLIVQIESLHRLKMSARPEPVDLLILDEVESTLAQFSSGLHKNFVASFAVFQWMLRTARHVICLDANLSDRTFCTLERMRPSRPIHLHWNRFPRAQDDQFYFTMEQASWLRCLYDRVGAGKRVVLPVNSLKEAKTLEACLKEKYPQKNVALYSSETLPSVKTKHFGDVHLYWKSLDILIYTPTVSAGADAGERATYKNATISYLLVDYGGPSLSRQKFLRSASTSTTSVPVYFATLRTLPSCLNQVASTGARVQALPLVEEGEEIVNSHRSIGRHMELSRLEAMASAPELSSDEATVVRERLDAQEDVEPPCIKPIKNFRSGSSSRGMGAPWMRNFSKIIGKTLLTKFIRISTG